MFVFKGQLPEVHYVNYCVIQQEEDGYIHRLLVGDLSEAIRFYETTKDFDMGFETMITLLDATGKQLTSFRMVADDIVESLDPDGFETTEIGFTLE